MSNLELPAPLTCSVWGVTCKQQHRKVPVGPGEGWIHLLAGRRQCQISFSPAVRHEWRLVSSLTQINIWMYLNIWCYRSEIILFGTLLCFCSIRAMSYLLMHLNRMKEPKKHFTVIPLNLRLICCVTLWPIQPELSFRIGWMQMLV